MGGLQLGKTAELSRDAGQRIPSPPRDGPPCAVSYHSDRRRQVPVGIRLTGEPLGCRSWVRACVSYCADVSGASEETSPERLLSSPSRDLPHSSFVKGRAWGHHPHVGRRIQQSLPLVRLGNHSARLTLQSFRHGSVPRRARRPGASCSPWRHPPRSTGSLGGVMKTPRLMRHSLLCA